MTTTSPSLFSRVRARQFGTRMRAALKMGLLGTLALACGACGGGDGDSSLHHPSGQCYDIETDTFYDCKLQGHPGSVHALWRDNVNGAYVSDAAGHLFAFSGDSQRALLVGAVRVPDVRATQDGHLLRRDSLIGYVALVGAPDGRAGAALLSLDGRAFSVRIEAGRLVLEGMGASVLASAIEPAMLAAADEAPSISEAEAQPLYASEGAVPLHGEELSGAPTLVIP